MMVLRGVQTLGNQLPIFKVAHDKVKMALDLFLLWVKPITLGKECYMGYWWEGVGTVTNLGEYWLARDDGPMEFLLPCIEPHMKMWGFWEGCELV